jgi:hypothetical protein
LWTQRDAARLLGGRRPRMSASMSSGSTSSIRSRRPDPSLLGLDGCDGDGSRGAIE